MKLSKHISGSLIVCVAAGAFAAGALFVDPSDSSSSAAPASPAAQAPAPAAATSPPGRYGGSTDSANGGATARANTAVPARIDISDFQISAARVAPGATVTVVNNDDTTHTVTARDGSFSTGKLRGGSSVSFVAPRTPGTYKVFCEIHPSMTSTLTVG
jgi:plastocyanin